MGVIVVVCAAFSLTISEAKCYKCWPYILALYLEPTYYVILHAHHQNNCDFVTLLVF